MWSIFRIFSLRCGDTHSNQYALKVENSHRYTIYVGYSERKYRLRISLAHPRDCHFAHVQCLPLSIEKPQTPFREIRVMFMFLPVR